MQYIITEYTLALVILSAFTLMAFLVHIFRRKQPLNLIPVIAVLVTVFLLYRLLGTQGAPNYYDVLSLDMCIALISTILAIFYISKPYIFIGMTVLLVAGFMIFAVNYPGNTSFAGMFAIGTIYGLLYREFALGPKPSAERSKKMKKVEIKRDVIQIFLGIVLVAVAMIFSYFAAISIIFALILLGYTSNNLLANLKVGPLYRKAMDLERKDATYGQGATYLAASTALVMGFTHTTAFLLFGIAVLFFADSLATIIGVSMKGAAKLPYNRNKTLVGTIAFFIVAAVAGYFLIGWLYGILFAFVLAFIESLGTSIDDNIRSGVMVVILGMLLGL